MLAIAAGAGIVAALAVLGAPFLLAPRRPLPPAPDPLVASDLANRLRVDLRPGRVTSTVRLSSEEATALLSQALSAWQAARADAAAGEELPVSPEQTRVRFAPGRVMLDGVLRLTGPDVPGYFRGRPIGISLAAEPRLEGERLLITVTEVNVGRLPVAPGLILGLLRPRLDLPAGIEADAGRGTLSVDTSLALAGIHLAVEELTIGQDQVTLTLAPREGNPGPAGRSPR